MAKKTPDENSVRRCFMIIVEKIIHLYQLLKHVFLFFSKSTLGHFNSPVPHIPASRRRWAHNRRHWPSLKTTFDGRLLFPRISHGGFETQLMQTILRASKIIV